jgi:hypothetical protein
MQRPVTLLTAMLLSGCGTTTQTLRVPLHEGPRPLMTDTSHITVRDLRPPAEREVRTGPIFSCERRYGDDTFIPSKFEYLKYLLAARLPRGEGLRLRIEHFDIIEYCEDRANKAGAAAATGASYAAGNGTVHVATGVPGGDSVLVFLQADVGGNYVKVSRRFDYSDLKWKFTELPAANAEYRNRLRKALGEIADEIVERMPGPLY